MAKKSFGSDDNMNKYYRDVLSGAIDMLNMTNVYSRDPEALKYTKDGRELSLIGMIKERVEEKAGEARSHRQQSRRSSDMKKEAFSAIYESMVEYAENYPASFPLRQRIKNRFREWLTEIKKEYCITGYEEDMGIDFGNMCSDAAVAMLQMLQEPEGISKHEMAERLGISERAVLKNLSKIDNSLGESEQAEQQIYIGGQPVQAKIRSFRADGERVSRYSDIRN